MTFALSEVIALVGFVVCIAYGLHEMNKVHSRMRREIEEQRIRNNREHATDLNEVTPGDR